MMCSATQMSGVVVRVVCEAKVDLPIDLEAVSPFIETIPTLNSLQSYYHILPNTTSAKLSFMFSRLVNIIEITKSPKSHDDN